MPFTAKINMWHQNTALNKTNFSGLYVHNRYVTWVLDKTIFHDLCRQGGCITSKQSPGENDIYVTSTKGLDKTTFNILYVRSESVTILQRWFILFCMSILTKHQSNVWDTRTFYCLLGEYTCTIKTESEISHVLCFMHAK